MRRELQTEQMRRRILDSALEVFVNLKLLLPVMRNIHYN